MRLSERKMNMRRRSNGFTLLELIIVIAIIGVLASLAISTYQTYTIRGQVAEGLSLASGVKTPIVDAYLQTGAAPADRPAAGLSPNATDASGGYVSAVEIVDGRIDVVFNGPRVHAAIAGGRLSLTPYESASGSSVAWQCGYADLPPGALLIAGAAHQTPSIEVRYLPGACRP